MKNHHTDFDFNSVNITLQPHCILLSFYLLQYLLSLQLQIDTGQYDWSKSSDVICMFLIDEGVNFVKCFLKSANFFFFWELFIYQPVYPLGDLQLLYLMSWVLYTFLLLTTDTQLAKFCRVSLHLPSLVLCRSSIKTWDRLTWFVFFPELLLSFLHSPSLTSSWSIFPCFLLAFSNFQVLH